MTPEQITLLRKSWAQVLPLADEVASTFYDTLFELDPGLRPLFKRGLVLQRRKLMMMLSGVVNQLDDPERLLPVVKALGERHANYGVCDRHYDTVGAALMSTLEQYLGAGLTADTRSAWLQAYTLLADTMKKAAADKKQATCSNDTTLYMVVQA